MRGSIARSTRALMLLLVANVNVACGGSITVLAPQAVRRTCEPVEVAPSFKITVLDETGAVLPGATIRVRQASGVVRSAVTSSVGIGLVALPGAGFYDLEVQMESFRVTQVKSVYIAAACQSELVVVLKDAVVRHGIQ